MIAIEVGHLDFGRNMRMVHVLVLAETGEKTAAQLLKSMSRLNGSSRAE